MRKDSSGEWRTGAVGPSVGQRTAERVSATSLTSLLAMVVVLTFALIIGAGLVLILS